MTEARLPPLPACLRPLALLLLMGLCRCEAPPALNCDLRTAVQLPLQVQNSLLVVPAGINGHWARLVVDTGAQRSTLSRALVKRLALRNNTRYVSRFQGIGGVTTSTDVTIDRLVLGGVHFPVDHMAVGSFDLHREGLDADGLLGADILLAFDMDIDVPAGKLTLYDAHVCPDRHPPWPQAETPYEITGIRAHDSRLLVPFELDGVRGMASLDTGAQTNLLAAAMAARVGLNELTMAADPATHPRGTGPNETIARLHRFDLMRIGPAELANPVLTVLPADAGPWDALIGEQFLQGRRIWISFRNRQVFVTRPLSQP